MEKTAIKKTKIKRQYELVRVVRRLLDENSVVWFRFWILRPSICLIVGMNGFEM